MKPFLITALLLPMYLFAQTPEKQGLREYLILDKGDTIRFYIYNPDNIAKTKVFLYLQGTGVYPMVNADDSGYCCMNNFPKLLMRDFPKEYAFIYINKMGMPYYINRSRFDIPSRFTERNNVLDRAEVANKVLDYVLKNIYPNARTVAVLGHSEGTRVLARLTSMNKKITHICFAAGSGYSHLYDQVLLTRRKQMRGEISGQEAQEKISHLYSGIDRVLTDTASTSKYLEGDTYKWWFYEINRPPIVDLIQLSIPILVTIGSSDNKVPVEGADYIKAEFTRLKKKNLTYKVFENADHGFQEMLTDGKRKDHWKEVFMDFLTFIEKTP